MDLVRHGQTDTDSCMRCAGYYSTDCLVGMAQGGCALRSRHEIDNKEMV